MYASVQVFSDAEVFVLSSEVVWSKVTLLTFKVTLLNSLCKHSQFSHSVLTSICLVRFFGLVV